jgi:hypothetical protein
MFKVVVLLIVFIEVSLNHGLYLFQRKVRGLVGCLVPSLGPKTPEFRNI